MKNWFTLLLLILLLQKIEAQQESRFPIQPQSVWRINYEYSCTDITFTHYNGDEEFKYFVDGDTLIGSRNYFKLFKTGILYLDSPFKIEHKYMGAIRDSADRFFFITEDELSEELLYDFSLNAGDSIYYKDFGEKIPIDEVVVLENGRKQFYFFIINVNCGSENTIIEGIGWLGGLLEGNTCSGHPGVRGSYLVCYSDTEGVQFQTSHQRCGLLAPCNLDITSVNYSKSTPEMSAKILSGGLLKVTIPEASANEYLLEIFDCVGVLRYRQNKDISELIDIGQLPKGVYYIRISGIEFKAAINFVILE